MSSPIPVAEIAQYLKVDPSSSTGLRRIKSTKGSYPAGTEAGTLDGRGYWQVMFNRRHYKNHRVVWALTHGSDPGDMQIDHIDKDRLNNDVSNLRLVTRRENHGNRTNQGKWPPGVYYDKSRRKFKAEIRKGGRKITLGRFDCPALAEAAYQSAAKSIHSETVS